MFIEVYCLKCYFSKGVYTFTLSTVYIIKYNCLLVLIMYHCIFIQEYMVCVSPRIVCVCVLCEREREERARERERLFVCVGCVSEGVSV